MDTVAWVCACKAAAKLRREQGVKLQGQTQFQALKAQPHSNNAAGSTESTQSTGSKGLGKRRKRTAASTDARTSTAAGLEGPSTAGLHQPQQGARKRSRPLRTSSTCGPNLQSLLVRLIRHTQVLARHRLQLQERDSAHESISLHDQQLQETDAASTQRSTRATRRNRAAPTSNGSAVLKFNPGSERGLTEAYGQKRKRDPAAKTHTGSKHHKNRNAGKKGPFTCQVCRWGFAFEVHLTSHSCTDHAHGHEAREPTGEGTNADADAI